MSQDDQNQSGEQGAAPAEVPMQDASAVTDATLVPIAVPAPGPAFEVVLDEPRFGPQGRPLLGGSLWVFGALFWAYLVMGELVVNLEVNEVFAMLVVMAASGVAWYGAVRQAPPGNLARKIVPGLIGIVLWAFTLLIVALLFGTSRRSTVEALTVVFCAPALGAYFVGRRLTANFKVEVSARRRAGDIALWVVCALATLIALISAVGHI